MPRNEFLMCACGKCGSCRYRELTQPPSFLTSYDTPVEPLDRIFPGPGLYAQGKIQPLSAEERGNLLRVAEPVAVILVMAGVPYAVPIKLAVDGFAGLHILLETYEHSCHYDLSLVDRVNAIGSSVLAKNLVRMGEEKLEHDLCHNICLSKVPRVMLGAVGVQLATDSFNDVLFSAIDRYCFENPEKLPCFAAIIAPEIYFPYKEIMSAVELAAQVYESFSRVPSNSHVPISWESEGVLYETKWRQGSAYVECMDLSIPTDYYADSRGDDCLWGSDEAAFLDSFAGDVLPIWAAVGRDSERIALSGIPLAGKKSFVEIQAAIRDFRPTLSDRGSFYTPPTSNHNPYLNFTASDGMNIDGVRIGDVDSFGNGVSLSIGAGGITTSLESRDDFNFPGESSGMPQTFLVLAIGILAYGIAKDLSREKTDQEEVDKYIEYYGRKSDTKVQKQEDVLIKKGIVESKQLWLLRGYASKKRYHEWLGENKKTESHETLCEYLDKCKTKDSSNLYVHLRLLELCRENGRYTNTNIERSLSAIRGSVTDPKMLGELQTIEDEWIHWRLLEEYEQNPGKVSSEQLQYAKKHHSRYSPLIEEISHNDEVRSFKDRVQKCIDKKDWLGVIEEVRQHPGWASDNPSLVRIYLQACIFTGNKDKAIPYIEAYQDKPELADIFRQALDFLTLTEFKNHEGDGQCLLDKLDSFHVPDELKTEFQKKVEAMTRVRMVCELVQSGKTDRETLEKTKCLMAHPDVDPKQIRGVLELFVVREALRGNSDAAKSILLEKNHALPSGERLLRLNRMAVKLMAQGEVRGAQNLLKVSEPLAKICEAENGEPSVAVQLAEAYRDYCNYDKRSARKKLIRILPEDWDNLPEGSDLWEGVCFEKRMALETVERIQDGLVVLDFMLDMGANFADRLSYSRVAQGARFSRAVMSTSGRLVIKLYGDRMFSKLFLHPIDFEVLNEQISWWQIGRDMLGGVNSLSRALGCRPLEGASNCAMMGYDVVSSFLSVKNGLVRKALPLEAKLPIFGSRKFIKTMSVGSAVCGVNMLVNAYDRYQRVSDNECCDGIFATSLNTTARVVGVARTAKSVASVLYGLAPQLTSQLTEVLLFSAGGQAILVVGVVGGVFLAHHVYVSSKLERLEHNIQILIQNKKYAMAIEKIYEKIGWLSDNPENEEQLNFELARLQFVKLENLHEMSRIDADIEARQTFLNRLRHCFDCSVVESYIPFFTKTLVQVYVKMGLVFDAHSMLVKVLDRVKQRIRPGKEKELKIDWFRERSNHNCSDDELEFFQHYLDLSAFEIQLSFQDVAMYHKYSQVGELEKRVKLFDAVLAIVLHNLEERQEKYHEAFKEMTALPDYDSTTLQTRFAAVFACGNLESYQKAKLYKMLRDRIEDYRHLSDKLHSGLGGIEKAIQSLLEGEKLLPAFMPQTGVDGQSISDPIKGHCFFWRSSGDPVDSLCAAAADQLTRSKRYQENILQSENEIRHKLLSSICYLEKIMEYKDQLFGLRYEERLDCLKQDPALSAESLRFLITVLAFLLKSDVVFINNLFGDGGSVIESYKPANANVNFEPLYLGFSSELLFCSIAPSGKEPSPDVSYDLCGDLAVDMSFFNGPFFFSPVHPDDRQLESGQADRVRCFNPFSG